MKTLFNTSDFQLTAEAQPRSTQHSANKTSKISHPLAQGSTMYLKAQRALSEAKREILSIYGSFVCFLNEEAHQDGTALILIERYEDGESVMYQYDIDTDGIFCECQL